MRYDEIAEAPRYAVSQRSQTVKFTDLLAAKPKLGAALNANIGIWRGVARGRGTILFVEPEKFVRKSANTLNYYTLLMDHDPKWSAFPKRSRSLICSTDESMARNYGGAYRVLPLGDPVVGICPADDLWHSFPKVIEHFRKFGGSIRGFNDALARIAKRFGVALPEDDGAAFMAALRQIDERYASDPDQYAPLKLFFEVNDSLAATLSHFFDPTRNGFTAKPMSAMGQPDDFREVWLSAPSFLIYWENEDDILRRLD